MKAKCCSVTARWAHGGDTGLLSVYSVPGTMLGTFLIYLT